MSLSWLPPEIPAMAPPPGQQSDFIHPKTLSPSLIAVNSVFLPMMVFSVAIRIYVRARITHSFWWDDVMVLVAAVSSICHTVVMLYIIHLGFGKHLWDIRAKDLTPGVLARNISLACIYPIAILFVKISIGLLYLRLFDRVVNRVAKRAIWAIIGFCIFFYLASEGVQIADVVLCKDVFVALTNNFCRKSANVTEVVTGVINTVTDFYLFVLPIPIILRLRLPRRRKIGVFIVLGAGFIACAVSLARLIRVVVSYHDTDALYLAAVTAELSAIEINVGITAASMVVMPSFLKSPFFKASTYALLWQRITPTGRTPTDQTPSSHPQNASPAPDSSLAQNASLPANASQSQNTSSSKSTFHREVIHETPKSQEVVEKRSVPRRLGLRTFYNPSSTINQSMVSNEEV